MVPKDFHLLIKPVGGNCNFDCTYCFYKEKKFLSSHENLMPDDILEKMISEFLELDLSTSVFCWQGGEPTLAGLDFFKKVVTLQMKYGKQGQIVGNALQSNGYLIDDAWVNFFNEFNFLVGISLDGPKEIHDTYRRFCNGGGTFEKVMVSIEKLQEKNVDFNVLSTVHKASVNKGKQIINWLISNGFKNLQFIPILERKINSDEPQDFCIDPVDYGNFLYDIFEVWLENRYGGVSVRLFENILDIYLGKKISSCIHKSSCNSYLLIEKNGDIFPCDFFVNDNYKIGNLLNSSIKNLVKSKDFISFSKLKTQNKNNCKNCRWYFICMGDCLRLRKNYDNKSFFCEANTFFFQKSEPYFLKLASEIKNTSYKPQRNDLCPCGSGRKYKKCCLPR